MFTVKYRQVQMAVSTGDAPTTLLQQCMQMLINAGQKKPLARIALLQVRRRL